MNLQTVIGPVAMAERPHPLRCAADLGWLPQCARYCPRCGAALDDPLPPAFGHLMSAPASDGTLDFTSQMVEGYANALYHLGRRFEAGPAGGNLREALRCYCKSARLGNVWAMARLASTCLHDSNATFIQDATEAATGDNQSRHTVAS